MPIKGILLIFIVAIIWAIVFRDEVCEIFHIDTDQFPKSEGEDEWDAMMNDFKEDEE